MKITEEVIPHIEKAIGFELYETQKEYLLHHSTDILHRGRRSGKTVSYCIKLALSEGEPLNMGKPYEFSDHGDGTAKYAYGHFRKEFLRYRRMLKDYGLPVREIITKA